MNKARILVFTLFFYSIVTFGQRIEFTPTQQIEIHKEGIKKSTFIIEGTVIKQECFYGGNGLGVLTCSLFQISKIFKGYEVLKKMGMIRVITKQGGQVGNGAMESISDGGSGIYQGGKYIILCDSATSQMSHEMKSDYKFAVTYMGVLEPICFSPIISWGQTYYKTIQEVYDFFKENGAAMEVEMDVSINRCHVSSNTTNCTLLPKVKKKLNSLYPNATDISLSMSKISDSNQLVIFHCNCPETTDEVVILFDTVGNVRYKEFHYHAMELLPDTIVKYIKAKTSSTISFTSKYMRKRIDNKGEISYAIMEYDTPNPLSKACYLLWFTSYGALLSKENQDSYR